MNFQSTDVIQDLSIDGILYDVKNYIVDEILHNDVSKVTSYLFGFTTELDGTTDKGYRILKISESSNSVDGLVKALYTEVSASKSPIYALVKKLENNGQTLIYIETENSSFCYKVAVVKADDGSLSFEFDVLTNSEALQQSDDVFKVSNFLKNSSIH